MSELKIKLVPSEDGASAIVRSGRRLTRVSLAGGSDTLGLIIPKYDRAGIERLARGGWLSRLEAASADFLRFRSEVREISSTVGTAAIDQAFTRDTLRVARTVTGAVRTTAGRDGRPPVATMRTLIGALQGTKRSTVEKAASLIKRLDRGVLGEIDAAIRSDSTGSGMRSYRELLVKYAQRLEVPAYFGLVVLEIVNSFQVQVMQSFARRSGISAEKVRQIYQNVGVRDQIRVLMERKGETASITWSIVPKEGSGSRTTELTVMLSGSGDAMQAVSAQVMQKSGIAVGERSLEEFYDSINDSTFSIELGLYYLSYFEELCRKSGMVFTTRIHEVAGTDDRIIILRLDL